jgi:exosortase
MAVAASKQWRWDVIIPTALIAAVTGGLFGFFPYAAGYGGVWVSVFEYASGLWQLEDWQHCFLVPPAVAFIVYLERKKLALLPVGGTWLGLPVLALGLASFWFGHLADLVYLGYGSMHLVLAGLILLFLGRAWFQTLLFPWMFLGFMWPLLFLDNVLAFPLRVLMSQASVATLNAIGIACTLSGTAILSASDQLTGKPVGQLFSVDVADPCSGIRSLFALMMVSALYGYFSLGAWWKRGVLFMTAIPLAVVGNLFRILMLTFGTIAMGSEAAIGSIDDPSFFHMLSGYVVFAVAIAGMLGIAQLLNLSPTRLRSQLVAARKSFSIPPPASQKRLVPREDAY